MQRPPASDQEFVDALLSVYRQGAFPMADVPWNDSTRQQAERAADDVSLELPCASRIAFFSPDPRAILPLEAGGFHVPGGLRRHVRRSPFTFTTDGAFERVIRACARPRKQRDGDEENGMWIDEHIARAYTMLHTHGHAHSIEAWLDHQLVGGVYGVHIGAAFFAESMFCRPDLGGSNASSLCLVHLIAHLRHCGFVLMDVQLSNSHTLRFGVIDVPRREYLERLNLATGQAATWQSLDPTRALTLLGARVC